MKSSNQPDGRKRRRKKRATPAQLRSRAAIAITSAGWSHLTEEQRRAWNVTGKSERGRPPLAPYVSREARSYAWPPSHPPRNASSA